MKIRWMQRKRKITAEMVKEYSRKKVEENPNYWSEKYDKEKAKKYREENRPVLMEKNWKNKGILDMTHEKYLSELEIQKGKCKICGKEIIFRALAKRKYCSLECAYKDHNRVVNSIIKNTKNLYLFFVIHSKQILLILFFLFLDIFLIE